MTCDSYIRLKLQNHDFCYVTMYIVAATDQLEILYSE